MLITLPVCLAFGFCLGYCWGEWGSAPFALNRLAQGDSRIWVVCAFVAIAGFAVLAAGFATSGHLFWLAGGIVGALAGKWFQNPEGSRDKLVFIAGATAFLFFGALEYDHRLFGNLAKIGGNEFSVEFSDSGRNRSSPAPPVVAAAQGYLGKVFPGSSGVRLAIGSLRDIPSFVMSDEYYSTLFADNYIANDYSIKSLSKPMKSFYTNYCDKIAPVASRLYISPTLAKGEIALLGADAQSIMELQDSYFQSRFGGTPPGLPPGTNEKIQNESKLAEAEIKTLIVKKMIQLIAGDTDPEFVALVYNQTTATCIEGLKQIGNGNSDAEGDQLDARVSSYTALTLSLIEFASGARETAIQLLEDEITTELKNIKAFPSTYAKGSELCPNLDATTATDCDSVQKDKYQYLQKIITLLRLEFVQNVMMGYLENYADRAKVRRWIGTSDRYEEALLYFDRRGEFVKSLGRSSFDDPTPASCATELRKRGPQIGYLFGKFVFADISAKNNALNLVGNNPSIIKSQPEIIDKLDRFADEVGNLDVECIALLTEKPPTSTLVLEKLTLQQEDVRARFLDSAASYWEAKGENAATGDAISGNSAQSGVISGEQIKSFCKAKSMYSLALQYAEAAIHEASTPNSASPNLDGRSGNLISEVEDDDPFTLVTQIRDGLTRATEMLNTFPAAELSAACGR